MRPKEGTEAAKKRATNKKAAATKKTAATPSKKKPTTEIFSDEPNEVRNSLMCLSKRDERWLIKAQDDDEAPKKAKPTIKVAANRALVANKKDPKRRRNSGSKDEREDRDERRPKMQKQNKWGLVNVEGYALSNHQGYSEIHGPVGEDDHTIHRSREEPPQKTCLEIGCYHKAATDGLCKTYAKDKNQGTLDDGTGKETLGFGCQEEGCGRFRLHATPGWCKIRGPSTKSGDGGSSDDSIPKQTARKPVSKASKAPKATPKAAPETQKAPATAAKRDGKCQRTTLANRLCTRIAFSGSQYCVQHQKPRKTALRDNDEYVDSEADSENDSDQNDDKDNGKKKPPTSEIRPLKTATKSTTTKASPKKAVPAKVPSRKPAAKNKALGENGRCGITTGNGTACKRIPAVGKDHCFQHKGRVKDIEVEVEESIRKFGEMENAVIMLKATIIDESGCLLDDGLMLR